MAGFTLLDFFILAMIGIGVWRGLRTGFGRQLVSTVGLFLAFIIGAALMGPVGSTVVESLGVSERTAPVVGFVVVFSVVLGGVSAVGHLFRKTLEAFKLSALDNMAGALLSGLKAALSLSILLMVTAVSPTPGGNPWIIGAETRDDSLLYEPVRALAPETWHLIETVTPGIQQALADKFNAWDERRRDADGEASVLETE
ncbi:MAG: CvpA family protein [Rhodothermaceae bacterium]|nr:CvpA family protein [Rhodothermaceae bacterium]